MLSNKLLRFKGLTAGAQHFYAATWIKEAGGIHVFIAEDRDAAAYAANDFYGLLDQTRVLFFPTSTKKSIVEGTPDPQGIVQRTAALEALAKFKGEGYLILCTYPEALAERVVDTKALERNSLHVKRGEKFSTKDLSEWLAEQNFTKVDFVYEPGQYSVRGGIFDVFSWATNRPYRLDFFGDEVDSIRQFEISSQLSAEKLDAVDIVPNLTTETHTITLPEFIPQAHWWSGNRVASSFENLSGEPDAEQEFHTAPQPKFNKRFDLLAEDISDYTRQGYTVCIATENRVQLERLQHIFYQSGYKEIHVESLPITLHEGFIDHDQKRCIYTDHQIFDRYQRYRLNGELKRDEQLTVSELNRLRVGDFVTHIDHGVGRFGGLTKVNEGGKTREAIKLIYRDGDILFVPVHALHRISRYKSGDAEEAPKVNKLGSGAWQKLKSAAKRAVKDISRELIALYARRKESRGFAFSHDGYMQEELEASFVWEDTPDQQTVTAAVKADMESHEPMDRLVCGDVGFGKTEVAIRAAFKAAADAKQTAVLVPTTILALQHWRTFSHRLKDFPVRVEYLNRTKSAKEVKQILADLEAGKIDILIGTHKMLGKDVKFHDLGLLIIDEEQKFGVAAKEKLTAMSVNVDTLTLTATPIPRTLQFSLMGSRDLSVISTPPPNRQPIVTETHTWSEELIKEAIEAELLRGGQVYFVNNRVEELPTLQGLVTRLCPQARVMFAHGQMPAAQLEKIVMDFIFHEFDVLIATTIIENGIDIPNANTIIINRAQNFGLSDLHQMRGRVGRGDRRAYCYLLTPPEEVLTSDARRRLRAIEEFADLGSGFNIAMQDLDIRGAGNLLGAEQSGFIADIGFETYQKIMQEAIAELRQEGLSVPGNALPNETGFITDAVVEVDADAELPDSYVAQQAEKLRLYRELDATKDEAALEAFVVKLEDRFGPLPVEARNLFDVVRLRREAVRLGMERVKVKNGLMIVTFVGDEQSPFYKSDTFRELLQRTTAAPDRFVLKQSDGRLRMTIRSVASLGEAYKVLSSL